MDADRTAENLVAAHIAEKQSAVATVVAAAVCILFSVSCSSFVVPLLLLKL